MTIKQLNKENIPNIIQLEKNHAPDKPHYARYDEKALNFIFDNPTTCKAYGIFEKRQTYCLGRVSNTV